MKFTLAWLKEHLETDASLDEIVFALTDLGLEVEGVTDPGAKLAAFTVGEVVEASPHPDADKLRVCRVMTGAGEKQIVCGAPNARAGIKVVVAAPGDHVPGTDLTLKVGKIRGVESHGMMLSEREMELSDEHNGILELEAEAPVGARFVDVRSFDPVIEIAVTPNRPDALGVAGIARDLAARGLGCATDIGSDSAMDAIRAQLDAPVRMLVQGAGVATAGGVLDASTAAITDAVNIKVGGLLRLVRAADARLAKGSRIVAIGGHYGFEPSAYAATAGVANAALANVVRQLSWAYGERGVTAHLVAPGPADTERLRRVATARGVKDGLDAEAVLAQMSAE